MPTCMVCLISCLRSWGMSERCAMSLMRVRGVLAVNSALKDGSLQGAACSSFYIISLGAALQVSGHHTLVILHPETFEAPIVHLGVGYGRGWAIDQARRRLGVRLARQQLSHVAS